MRILIRGDTASTDTGLKEGGKGEGRGGVSDINTGTMHAECWICRAERNG